MTSLPSQAPLLVLTTLLFLLPRLRSLVALMQKWKKSKLNTPLVWWLRARNTTRSSIFGLVLTIWLPNRWWKVFLKKLLSTVMALKNYSLHSTPYLCTPTQVRVVRPHRFVSWRVCVVWWRVLMARSLRPPLRQTSAKAWTYFSTLFLRTVRVKVWRIPHWRQPTPVTWPVVWLMWRRIWWWPCRIVVPMKVWPCHQ